MNDIYLICSNNTSLLATIQQHGAQLLIHTLIYWTQFSAVLVFFSWRVLECNLVHQRSVALLCMLFKITSNPMHPLRGALPLTAPVTRAALFARRHSFAPLRCITSHSAAGH